jgi:hypothetical protein
MEPYEMAALVYDYVAGAESDSGHHGPIGCSVCGGAHTVSISNIGWFLYVCRGKLVSGKLKDWRNTPLVVKKGGPADEQCITGYRCPGRG